MGIVIWIAGTALLLFGAAALDARDRRLRDEESSMVGALCTATECGLQARVAE